MPENETAEEYLSPIINDGQNRTSTIPAKPGVYSAVQIRWRKLDADSIEIVAARARMNPEAGFCRHYAEQLAPHKNESGALAQGNVIAWDVKDSKGVKMPVTAEAIRGSHHEFYDDLVAVCEGRRPEWEINNPDAKSAGEEIKNS